MIQAGSSLTRALLRRSLRLTSVISLILGLQLTAQAQTTDPATSPAAPSASPSPDQTAKHNEQIKKRMERWATLSPTERKEARAAFINMLEGASPEDKAKLRKLWERYKQLPEEEKRKLKDQAKK